MNTMLRAAVLAALSFSLLNGCTPAMQPGAVTSAKHLGTVEYQRRHVWSFQDGVRIDNEFEGARVNDCIQIAAGEYEIKIEPENAPINGSPWYAFRISAATVRSVVVRLSYGTSRHRYIPAISTDAERWIRLPAEAYSRSADGASATLRLEVGTQPLWVAGQEMIGIPAMEAWSGTLERLPFVTRRQLGSSLAGRPLNLLEIRAQQPSGKKERERPCIVIIGRQHPPEVTGTLGLFGFVETIVGDSELARRFRERFDIYVVPLMNPDGVFEGHWRHSLNGIDLNRDWEKFTHPETRAVRDFMLQLKSSPETEPYLFLDFHSTFHDLFYIPPEDSAAPIKGFTAAWLQSIQKRFPDYVLKQDATYAHEIPCSLAWVYKTLGIPAIVSEWGDATDRALLNTVASGAAEEMMRLMLANGSGG